ncbi:hypothetical protein MIND_01148700 [Mycena indigotica]|uniref:Uncharacterized protein n=1 Tax=Mycena indigotica TaxID=2126181 RepID=A0A8H6VTT3_9AGAR|nr:uncharacterized protein MIND_01148700 [Mycena indigotica]KAF7293687.1 hypothetical protein MIND_01148700 [Mycena indigotica]
MALAAGQLVRFSSRGAKYRPAQRDRASAQGGLASGGQSSSLCGAKIGAITCDVASGRSRLLCFLPRPSTMPAAPLTSALPVIAQPPLLTSPATMKLCGRKLVGPGPGCGGLTATVVCSSTTDNGPGRRSDGRAHAHGRKDGKCRAEILILEEGRASALAEPVILQLHLLDKTSLQDLHALPQAMMPLRRFAACIPPFCSWSSPPYRHLYLQASKLALHRVHGLLFSLKDWAPFYQAASTSIQDGTIYCTLSHSQSNAVSRRASPNQPPSSKITTIRPCRQSPISAPLLYPAQRSKSWTRPSSCPLRLVSLQ